MEGYDLIIVGGGIYGLMLSKEAKERGLRSLLLEKGRIAGATSRNSFQIIHGGLRYLQSLNFKRYQEMVKERSWLLRTYPDYVKPLPCLFPLYNKGLYRKSVFRVALGLDHYLSYHRNQGLREENYLKRGQILTREETLAIIPHLNPTGLQGGAVWNDAQIVEEDKLIDQILSEGGEAKEYCEAKELIVENGEVRGVLAIDNGQQVTFYSNRVINAAGPWCTSFAKKAGLDVPELFRPSLAVNLIFNRKALSDHCVAIRGAHTYFVRSYQGKLFAGTYHRPWKGSADHSKPEEADIERFIDDLNLAIPKLHLKKSEIATIRSGLIPVKKEGSIKLAVNDPVIDHGKTGEIKGFYSLAGAKWTTARNVAKKALTA